MRDRIATTLRAERPIYLRSEEETRKRNATKRAKLHRVCACCPALLSAYNPGSLCGPCGVKDREAMDAILAIPKDPSSRVCTNCARGFIPRRNANGNVLRRHWCDDCVGGMG